MQEVRRLHGVFLIEIHLLAFVLDNESEIGRTANVNRAVSGFPEKEAGRFVLIDCPEGVFIYLARPFYRETLSPQHARGIHFFHIVGMRIAISNPYT
ncbi:MAG: hypothetical protein Q4G52_06700 [Clostridia bacterium]|nr:hypothetical protein [Clostridia bacterium]